jgi:hypothetical protein
MTESNDQTVISKLHQLFTAERKLKDLEARKGPGTTMRRLKRKMRMLRRELVALGVVLDLQNL